MVWPGVVRRWASYEPCAPGIDQWSDRGRSCPKKIFLLFQRSSADDLNHRPALVQPEPRVLFARPPASKIRPNSTLFATLVSITTGVQFVVVVAVVVARAIAAVEVAAIIIMAVAVVWTTKALLLRYEELHTCIRCHQVIVICTSCDNNSLQLAISDARGRFRQRVFLQSWPV